MSRRTIAAAGILVMVVLFFAINVLANAALRSMRIDLTDQGLYTLSDGSRNIAAGIDEPITLTLYYSESLATGRPLLQSHGRRVRELLEEYVRRSGGSITLNVIDPVPFSEAEDEVAKSGLRALPLGQAGNFYFGLVGTNTVDGREVLPFFDPSQEQFLEYEISRLIHTLAQSERPKIGLLSSLPIDGSPPNQMLQQPGRPPWQIMRELRSLFDVTVLTPGAPVPDDIGVLLVVHPKNLDDATRYAIDQHVVRGGAAIIFVDPHCEADQHPMPQSPMDSMQWPRASDLTDVFAAWGLTMVPDSVVADRELAQRVRMNAAGGRQETVPYIVWIGVTDEFIDGDDPVTGRLGSINLAAAGGLAHDPAAGTTFTPLVSTSTDTSVVPVDKIRFMPDPKALLTGFVSANQTVVLAGRLTGVVDSAFASAPEGAVTVGAHVGRSAAPVKVIVVSDVDMLADQFWVQRGGLFGPQKIADNGDFVVNAVENLSGSSDLISIRARGEFARPFTKVEDIRRAAEEEYLGQEQELEEKLRETERKLNELPMATQANGQLILTPEQQAELERFQEERADTRRQLRAVQLDLRKDIEALGTRLKVINIAALPLAVTLTAVGVGLFRMSRRRSGARMGRAA